VLGIRVGVLVIGCHRSKEVEGNGKTGRRRDGETGRRGIETLGTHVRPPSFHPGRFALDSRHHSLTLQSSPLNPNPKRVMPDILKYFHEEPALLEPLTPDRDPDARNRRDRGARRDEADGDLMPIDDLLDTTEAYRGYLAGTSLSRDTVGLTTLNRPSVYVEPILTTLGRSWWGRARQDGSTEALTEEAVREILREPRDTTVVVTADAPIAAERITAAAGTARRHALPALRDLLTDAAAVLFPEPAHDGHDWSFFAARPVRERFVAALRKHAEQERAGASDSSTSAVRRFVVPYQKARSESKFYFETWQLTEPSLPDYIVEV